MYFLHNSYVILTFALRSKIVIILLKKLVMTRSQYSMTRKLYVMTKTLVPVTRKLYIITSAGHKTLDQYWSWTGHDQLVKSSNRPGFLKRSKAF